MPSDCITFQESDYFSSLIIDYLNQDLKLKPLYNRFPTIENFKKQIEEKSNNYNNDNRIYLTNSLSEQYKGFSISDKTKNNIELLKDSNTFTITTGHQLNLFTGPLYFLYKIISTINLTEQLNIKYPNYNFVPIYWMATEDHDFEEINHFTFEEKVIHWNQEALGPVGRLSTEKLESVYQAFSLHLGIGKNAEQLREWFKNAYLKHSNLAEATRYLVNEIFGSYGLVILDGDNKELKSVFSPHIKQELLERKSIEKTKESFSILNDYYTQVTPREINLFYITDTLRERIILKNNLYTINNTSTAFSEESILLELENHPERFSPNVILRPLYQEVILPNICYIGGGGELAYWLELKKIFELHQTTFPILLLRNSALLVKEKQAKKLDKLKLNWKDLFLKNDKLIVQKTKELSSIKFDFSSQRHIIETQFRELEQLTIQTDKSFLGAVKAQKQKQINGLNQLEKRLLKAEKKSHRDILERITKIQLELFPNNNLQERVVNFSEYYKEFGNNLIPNIKEKLNPLDQEFNILIF